MKERRPLPVFPRDVRAMEVGQKVRRQDLCLFEAIAGKQPEYDAAVLEIYRAKAAVQARELSARRKINRVPTLASLKLSLRLREWCEQGASRVSRPQVAGWLRHISDEAFHRLEEAQARLAAARTQAVQRIEVRPVTPQEPVAAPQHPYMRIA